MDTTAPRPLIQKASGEWEPFDPAKVERSLKRARISPHLRTEAVHHITQVAHDGMSTKEVYQEVHSFLRERNQGAAQRYSLKDALMRLGPSGFPFEQFLARMYTRLGYQSTTNLTLAGTCVTHEIDVLLEKDGVKTIVEAKFHNGNGVRTDVKVMLYMYSRFLDVKEKHGISNVCVATNTKVTQDALQFAQCRGIQILSWEYPSRANLPDLIEQTEVHPITECLNISAREQEQLLEKGVVMCHELTDTSIENLRQKTGLPMRLLERAQSDAAAFTPEP